LPKLAEKHTPADDANRRSIIMWPNIRKATQNAPLI
jgi:hypothetical protein